MKNKGFEIPAYILLKLLLALCTLWLTQVLFHLANLRLFHLDGFGEWMGVAWGNVVFGIATVGAFLLPWMLLMLLPVGARRKRWYRILCEVLYIIPVLLMVIPRGANAAYYQYTYRLLSEEIFSYLGIGGQMGTLVPLFAVDYWYAWVFPLAIIVAFFMVNSRIRLNLRSRVNVKPVARVAGMAVGLLLAWFMVWGGFGHMLRLSDAGHYCQPKNAALVSNDSYNILRTLLNPNLDEVEYMSDDELVKLYEPLYSPRQASPTLSADSAGNVATQRNVVLIIVESLGQEFMGCYNTQPDAETRTPFLDSLAQHCTLYDGRSNGKKSIEGITAITTGIPNLMSRPFINSCYYADDLEGIPTVLGRHGYYSGFFHGSYNGEMGFDSLCRRLGFDEYLGKDEFEADPQSKPTDYDGAWGIFDEPFLQYMVRHLAGFRQPFFAEVFTVTSHHPFPIPEEHKGRFAEGRHPILKCVEYTDYSLRRFFEEAQKQPWYNNTLFIITGDHSGHGLTREYNNYDGWYRIPLMIFDPQRTEGHRSNRIVQHTDLMPSLVDWLGIQDEHFVAFGQSVVQHPERGWVVYYGNGYYVLENNSASDGDLHETSVLMGDVATGEEKNLRFLKAIVQQYNHRVINNQLKAQHHED